MTFFDQFLFQAKVVLYNPVVHHDNFPGAVTVGMRIFLGRTPVRGPAGMPDAVASVERFLSDSFFQIAQLALSAAQLEAISVSGHRNSGRIVAAIFQPAQPFNDDWNDTFLADVPDDTAH